MTYQDVIERWGRLSAAWRNIMLLIGTIATGIVAFVGGGYGVYVAAQQALENKYATHAAVDKQIERRVGPIEERVMTVEQQAATTQREVTRTQILQSTSEVGRLNDIIFQLEKSVNGNLLRLSPVERSYYDDKKDDLRRALQERNQAEQRFRELTR